MLVYHGSDHIIEKPVYHGSKRTNDYGYGFLPIPSSEFLLPTYYLPRRVKRKLPTFKK